MCFADKYLRKHKIYPDFISESPQKDLKYIVVIPVYNEPDVITSIESLYRCFRPVYSAEIIIVINSSSNSNEQIKQNNLKTLETIKLWEKTHREKRFRFFIIHVPDLPPKFAGAGMARKTGMDEAISRFNQINNNSGVIISFDADCICDNNYFIEIEKRFRDFPETNCCTIYFEHPVEGAEYDEEIYNGITHYELYLRYFKHALQYTGFPFAYYTIGSCFAVKASVYVKQGGMNRKKAGEDFYFLHKVFPGGNIVELNTTRVIPSPRSSNRVIFGTSKEMEKWLKNKKLDVYNFQAFKDLKLFLNNGEKFINLVDDKTGFSKLLNFMPESVKEFLIRNNFYYELEIINSDCKKQSTIKKRFYQWFDAFRVIKYLNFAHEDYYSKLPVCEAAAEFLDHTQQPADIKEDAGFLLEIFRIIDKNL